MPAAVPLKPWLAVPAVPMVWLTSMLRPSMACSVMRLLALSKVATTPVAELLALMAVAAAAPVIAAVAAV